MEMIQVKTYDKYIERLKKKADCPFKIHEVARFHVSSKNMTNERAAVIKMFASTNEMLARKRNRKKKMN